MSGMPTGKHSRHLVILLILFFVQSILAAAPSTAPATQASDPPLPPGAIRRFGDLRFADGQLNGEVFSDDDRRLISYGNGFVSWDVSSGWELHRNHFENFNCAGGGSCGPNQIALGFNLATSKQQIVLVEKDSGKELSRLDRAWPTSMLYFASSPDASRFAVVADHIWLRGGKSDAIVRDLGQTPHNNPSFYTGPRVQFSSDGSTLVAVSFDGNAHLIDAATGNDKINHTFPANLCACVSGDGKTLATIPEDRMLHVYDIAADAELPVPPIGPKPEDAAAAPMVAMRRVICAPNGLLAFSTSDGKLYLLDTRQRPLPPAHQIRAAPLLASPQVFSADGTLLAVFDGAGRRMVLDMKTEKPVSPPSFNMRRVTAMAVSPDGREMLCGNSLGELFRWDLTQGTLLQHRDAKSAIDFSRGSILELSYFDQGRKVLQHGQIDDRTCDAKTLVTQTRFTPLNGLALSGSSHPHFFPRCPMERSVQWPRSESPGSHYKRYKTSSRH